MNMIIKKKTILLLAAGSFVMSGCVEKNEMEPPKIQYATKLEAQAQQQGWKFKSKPFKNKRLEKLSHKKIEACVDCVAPAFTKKVPPSPTYASVKKVVVDKPIDTFYYGTYDYTVAPEDTVVPHNVYVQNSSYEEKEITPVAYMNSSQGGYSSKGTTAIQIGAFRHYAGAKEYLRRYSVLSTQHGVTIKTGIKGGKPIHRVRIEGFSSRPEAKKFMERFGLSDAFLVRK